MTRYMLVLVAGVALAPLVAVAPAAAWAQKPTPANSPPSDPQPDPLAAKIAVAFRLHQYAAARCDRAEMLRQIHKLLGFEVDARTVLRAAINAGEFSAVSPETARERLRNATRVLRTASQTPPSNCRTDKTKTQQTAPAQPQTAPPPPPTPLRLVDLAKRAFNAFEVAEENSDYAEMERQIAILEKLNAEAIKIAQAANAAGKFSTVNAKEAGLVALEVYWRFLGARQRLVEARKYPIDNPKTTQGAFLDRTAQRLLAAHNKTRAEAGVPLLEWDPQLAAQAAAYGPALAQHGRPVHAPRTGRKTSRENLLQALPGTPVDRMVGVWIAERRHFVPGTFPNVSRTGNWADVGHYTQMVWRGTTRVGCAVHRGGRFDWLICRYSPPGNQDGKPVL